MRLTRAPDNTASKPAKTDTGSGGWYTAGPPATVFSADDANMIQAELKAMAELKGVSLDTTGANDHQCADALGGVRAIEAHNVEATAIDSYFSMAVIASDDAEVGEDDNGAEHCAVIAGQLSAAKGFESVAVGVYKMKAAGDQSAVIASKSGSGSAGHSAVTGAQSVAIGAQFTTHGDHVTGDYAGVICGINNAVTEDGSVAVGGNGNELTGGQSFIGGGNGNSVVGYRAAIVGGGSNVVETEYGAVVGGFTNEITEGVGQSSAHSVIAGGTLNTIADAEDAFIAGGDNNRIGQSCDGAAIIGSQYARVDSKANCVVLGSRHIDTDLSGSDAANYSVCGGYDAASDVKPSWALQSNGGVIYATNTTVQGVDYAELIPNADGRAHEPGRLLTFDGRGVRLASRGDECEGVVSVHPTVLGGADELGWSGMYLRDKWGAYVWEDVEEVTLKAPDREAMQERQRRTKVASAEARAAERILARAEKDHASAVTALERASADAERAEAEAIERERHAATRAQEFADAGKIRKIVRGSAMERLAARAAESAAVARTTADAKHAEVDELMLAADVALEHLNEARAAAVSVSAEPDLSDLSLDKREVKRTVRQRKLNPAWDRERAKKHTPRSKRPEQWTKMGVLGQMRVAVDETVKAGSYVVPGDMPGIGTHADNRGTGIRIRVLEIETPYDKDEGLAVAYCWVGR